LNDLTPDELQIAFHEVECATYDERFGILLDRRGAEAAAREFRRLVDGAAPACLGRVLDVGCGTGYLGLGLRQAGVVRELHAVDISPGMLERAADTAAKSGIEATFVRAGADALPYPDGSFDAVITRGVLHHLHDPVAALSEWRRVAKPGTPVVLVSEPSPQADRVGGQVARLTLRGLAVARRAARAAGRPLSAHPEDEAEQHRFWDLVALAANLHTFTPDDLRRLADASGFRHAEVRASGLVSIAWACGYYVIAGELPGLMWSDDARRRASRVWAGLRRVDSVLADRLLPARALLTVQAVLIA
jgi:SAM-dependent methyltransferase